jgi:hypothetical protein
MTSPALIRERMGKSLSIPAKKCSGNFHHLHHRWSVTYSLTLPGTLSWHPGLALGAY